MAQSLAELMAVESAEEEDHFLGQSEAYGPIGVYGGHFVGQALAAGLATVEEPKLAHSVHCYFLRPGDPATPIRYAVTRMREGRGSDVRNIIAYQHSLPVFQMMASFKLAEDSDEHQPTMPKVDDVETLLNAGETQDSTFSPPPTVKGRTEMVLASDHFIQPEFIQGREAVLQVWMRCNSDVQLSDRAAQTVLAFLSDGTLMFNSVIPHGLPFQTHRLTSIDHAVWFHRRCDVTDWMLFDQHSSAAADGRGMNHGALFDRHGVLLMTAAQESMLRKMPPPAE